MTSPFSLADRRVLVTGANTGIGQGIAVAAARAGAHIIGAGRSPMDETAALVAADGGTFEAIATDLADPSAPEQLIAAAWPLHGLVNNAGIIRRADSVDHTTEDWGDVIAVNLTATFQMCQSFGRRILAEGRAGKIVNVTSLLSFQGGIRVAAYTASKHAVAGITKTLCNEWAAQNINVNAIAPGYIETNNTTALRADPDRSAAILSRIPAGRWGHPDDIGGVAVFLLAPASDYIHGAIIPIDGGWLAR